MGKTRIPQTLNPFDSYLKTVVAHLLAIDPVSGLHNWERLGLTQAEMTAISAFFTSWYTGNPAAPGAYELHVNPDKKTKETRRNVLTIMKNFNAYFEPLLIRMSGSAALTNGDMLVLNIKLRSKTVSRITQKININIHIITIAVATGMIRLKFYGEHESSKPAIPEGADRIQTAIAIIDPSFDGSDVSGMIKKTAPLHADDGTFKEIHSRASFIVEFNSIYAGKELYIYARYYLDRHPELAGPRCPVHVVRIPY